MSNSSKTASDEVRVFEVQWELVETIIRSSMYYMFKDEILKGVFSLIELTPIGFVRKVRGEEAYIELLPAYEPGLLGIESHKHIFLLYWMHKQKDRFTLQVHPKRDPSKPTVGVFACRSPARPNPIGLSSVELIRREGRMLIVKGLDALEDTPILDIKPLMPSESDPGDPAQWL